MNLKHFDGENVYNHCPEHAPPNADIFNSWPCPDDCHHFIAELERRIDDIKVNGNYVRVWKDDDGAYWREEYANHQPTGPKIMCRSILGDTLHD